MANITFPVTLNKEIEYPINLEKEKFYPVYLAPSTDPISVRSYGTETNAETGETALSEVESGWGNDPLSDMIWIGKDIDFLEFGFFGGQRYEISSLAFEDGRTDFQNIFAATYEDTKDGPTLLEETEFTDLSTFPFIINTSIRLPEGITEFPGITLEAPFNMRSPESSWTCRVVIPKTVTSFRIVGTPEPVLVFEEGGGNDSNNNNDFDPTWASGKNEIKINENLAVYHSSLNSEKGTVEIYLLDHTDKPTLYFDGDLDCRIKLIVNSTLFSKLCEEWGFEDEETANENNLYKFTVRDVSGFETKVAETFGTGSLDIAVNPLEVSKIDDILNAPILEVVSAEYGYDETASQNCFTGTLRFFSNNSSQVKYITFKYFENGTVQAESFILNGTTKIGLTNVSSQLVITVKSLEDGNGNNEMTVSFQNATATSIVNDGSIGR